MMDEFIYDGDVVISHWAEQQHKEMETLADGVNGNRELLLFSLFFSFVFVDRQCEVVEIPFLSDGGGCFLFHSSWHLFSLIVNFVGYDTVDTSSNGDWVLGCLMTEYE